MLDTRQGRIRLLTMVCNFDTGGTEGQVLQLLKNLDQELFELRVACLDKSGSLLPQYEALGISIDEFRIRKLYSPQTFMQILHLARFMREQRIQIVHCYNFYALVIGIPAARLAGVPVKLVAIRDRGIYLSRAKKIVQHLVCNLAEHILVNADSIRDWLQEEGYPPDRISVIKNAIDMDRYTHAPACSIRQEFAIPTAARVVVMISRLNRQKGVEEFIRAAGIVGRDNPDIHFLLVGRPSNETMETGDSGISEFDRWNDLINHLGMRNRILFTGNRSDIPSILKEATISVLPSHSEGLSNVLLESMAAGVPTIATNTGGSPELVADEINGLLVPVMNHNALAAAMSRILNDQALANRFSRQAVARVRSEFSSEHLVRDTQALYFSQLKRELQIGEKRFSL